jgi:hypothetical protein
MEEKVRQVLAEHGLTESQLTKEELEELKEEIKEMEQGRFVLDGVLHNPELYYRRKKDGHGKE